MSKHDVGERLLEEFSFIEGNYAIVVIRWILIDFAGEIPATYYALYVLNLGATETILGIIGLMGFLALASKNDLKAPQARWSTVALKEE